MEGVQRSPVLAGVGLAGLAALAVALVVVDDGGAFVASPWTPTLEASAASLALGASIGLALAGMRARQPARGAHPRLDLRWAWWAVAVGCMAVAAVHVSPRWFDSIAREDWIVEWVSAIAALTAAAWAWSAGKGQAWVVRVPLWALAACFFVMAGEEVSWLQRLLGYGTPEVLDANSQGEANLHNLATDEVQSAFYLGASILLVLLPFAARWGPQRIAWVRPFAPGRTPLAFAVASVAFAYARTGLVAHHVTFWVAVAVLILWRDGPPDALTLALLATLVLGQAAVATGGADLERAWGPSEYREALTAVAFAAWSRELLLRSRRPGSFAAASAGPSAATPVPGPLRRQ